MKLYLRYLVSVGASILLVSALCSKDLPSDTLERRDAILKLFHDEFVRLTPGQGKFPAGFMMGSLQGLRANEQPAHQVTFTYEFAIGKHEVTQELYFVVVGKNPAKWTGRRNSVEMANWHEA